MKELMERLSEPLLRIYSDMQADLLVAIIKRLAADKTLLEDGAFMEWHFRKLNQLNGLTRESIAIISRSTGIAEKELIEAIRKAGFESIKDNEGFLKDAHKQGAEVTPPPPPERDPTIINILDSYQRQARDRLNLVNSTLIEQVGQTYRDVVNRVTADMLAGLKSPQRAMRDMARQL
ncbi:minor capsid protein, partial [Klebsiella pneumoniae]